MFNLKNTIMKNIMYAIALVFCGSIYAQQTPPNTKEETETKTVKVKTNDKTVEQKVKVTTTEQQDIKLKDDPNHYENMNRVDTPTNVTKTMSISYEDDPFYSSNEDARYFNNNGTSYMFKPDTNGFMVTQKDNPSADMYAKARLSSLNRLYLINMGEKNGVGYFKNGKFVIEYYDSASDSMVVQEFDSLDQ